MNFYAKDIRNGISKDDIGEMLGHSNSKVTEHYLAGLNKESIKCINRIFHLSKYYVKT